jgi:hypothetical protein
MLPLPGDGRDGGWMVVDAGWWVAGRLGVEAARVVAASARAASGPVPVRA